jgi:hypothetical protein
LHVNANPCHVAWVEHGPDNDKTTVTNNSLRAGSTSFLNFLTLCILLVPSTHAGDLCHSPQATYLQVTHVTFPIQSTDIIAYLHALTTSGSSTVNADIKYSGKVILDPLPVVITQYNLCCSNFLQHEKHL